MKMILISVFLIFAVTAKHTGHRENTRKEKPLAHKSASYIRTFNDALTSCKFEFRKCLFEEECLIDLEECGFFDIKENLRRYD
jgi:hypothetical protein